MDLAATLELAIAALAIEAFIGYPQGLFCAIGHPVSWAGRLIALSDQSLNRSSLPFWARRALGFATLALILAIAGGGAYFLALGLAASPLPKWMGQALTALLASSLLAQRSLYQHVAAAAEALEAGLPAGRAAVAKIAGRDVERLDEAGVARAAIESLAENFSDAVVAPAVFLAAAGLPGGVSYKAINTADSMIGHRTERHAAFGFAAAKLDDLVNFFPARLAALAIVISAAFVEEASARDAWSTMWRDARGHPSPNAGWPEAAMAGALGVRLGGPRSYSEIMVNDAWIGRGKDASAKDIRRALEVYRRACAVHWACLLLAALTISQA
jgi:adenosylcobinamide-phosphate synthase